MTRSLSPVEIASFGCTILAGEALIRANRAGNTDDATAEFNRSTLLRQKAAGLRDGSVKYIPILDADLQTAYDTAIRRLKP
jgi:hypothetical protein